MLFHIKHFICFLLITSGLTLASWPTMALNTGDWLVRGRIINIDPDSSSNDVTANGQTIPNTSVSVSNAYTLDIDITYMFSPYLGAELLLDLSSEHEVSAEGSTLSSLAPGHIINTRVLPPALILQYHFIPEGVVRPYAGFGFNYTYFFDEKATASLDKGLGGVSGLSLDSSFGWVAQFGVDYEMGNDWFLNADVKYMDIDTTATFQSNNLGDISVDVDINPWVFGLGMGKRF